MNYTFYGLVSEVKRQVLSTDNSIVMTVAMLVASIFACFAIIAITKESMTSNGSADIKLWRPLAILVILPMFGQAVIFFDSVMTGVADAVWVGVSNDKDNYDAKYMDLVAKVESIKSSDDWMSSIKSAFSSSEDIDGLSGDSNVIGEAAADQRTNRGEDKGWFEKVWDRVKGWASSIANTMVQCTGNILSFLLSFLMNCVRYCLVGAAGVYLMVLGIIGPLVLAISLLPTFENTIWQWVARYIQVSMWVPLVSLVDFVNCKVRVAMINSFSVCNIETMATFPVHQLLLNIIMLGMLFAVPSMANWIIQSTGAANVHRGLVQKAGVIATRIITKH